MLPIRSLAAVLLLALDAAAGEACVARCAAVGRCVARGHRGCLRVGGRHSAVGMGVDGRRGWRNLLILLLVMLLVLLMGDGCGRWTWDTCEVCI